MCFPCQIRYLHGLSVEAEKDDIYGFIDPHFMTPMGNKNPGTKPYIQNSIMQRNKKIFIAPYIDKYLYPYL